MAVELFALSIFNLTVFEFNGSVIFSRLDSKSSKAAQALAPSERLTPLSLRSIDSGWVWAPLTRLPFVICSAAKLKGPFILLPWPRLEGKGELNHAD